MKEIYKMLGEIEINEEELKMLETESVEMSELEKARIKTSVKNTLKMKQTKKWSKNLRVAAVLTGAIVAGTAGIGIINPTYAAELPIVGDIFRFLDNGRTGAYDLYKENANEINVTKESNGVAITIKDAVFDGRTISYTYEIKTDRELGENVSVGVGPIFSVEGYEGGMGGSGQVQRIGEDTYVGIRSYTLNESYEEINCKVNIKDIILIDEVGEETIEGKWRFDFKLNAVDGEVVALTEKVEQDGFKIAMENITFTPMSFSLDYMQQVPEDYRGDLNTVTTTLEVKDNLGNIYSDEGSSGHADGEEVEQGILHVRTTFGKVAEGATQLIVTPTLYSGTYGGGIMIDEEGNETELKPDVSEKELNLTLDPIVIELQR